MSDVQIREGLVLGELVTVDKVKLEALIAQHAEAMNRAEVAEKYAAGLEAKLAAVIQRAEAAEKLAEDRKAELAAELDSRIVWQNRVYLVCNELDRALGRHVSKGTGTLAYEDSLLPAIREPAEAQKDTERLDKLETRLRNHFALRPLAVDPAIWCGAAGIRIEPQGFIAITSIGDKDARYDLRAAIDAAKEGK